MAEHSPNPEQPKPSAEDQAAPDDAAQELRSDSDAESTENADVTDAAEDAGPSTEQAAEQAINSAEEATEKIRSEAVGSDSDGEQPSHASGATPGSEPVNYPDLAEHATTNGESRPADLHLLDDIDLEVKIELGRTEMYVEDVLRLNENSVVELDKAAGDPVDIYVNNRHVARGEVLVLNENFCVRISEIIRQHGEGTG